MTNYFGKSRLIKLFYHYISNRTEYFKSFKAAVKEYGKETMFCYKKYRGSEWLEAHHEGYHFNFYVFGHSTKTIDFKEFQYNCESDEGELLNKIRIISYYTADFYPALNNKDKSLDCYTIAKKPISQKQDTADAEEKNCDVIFLDTETTGLDSDTDEILQISIVNNNGDILLDSYIRPERNTEWEAAEEIHHISYDMIKDAPLASDIAPKIFEIIANAKVVIAYNISFDWKFILRILENNGYNLDEKAPELKCCMEKFAEVYGEWDEYRQCYRWQKLSTAANYYYPKVKWRGKAHGSLADTLMCRDVWNEIHRD